MDNQLQLETSVIAILLNQFEMIDGIYIDDRWFTTQTHRMIIKELQEDYRNIDGLMHLYARVQGKLQDSSFSYQRLLEIQKSFTTTSHLSYLVNELHRNYLRQTFKEVAQEHQQFATVEQEDTMLALLTVMSKIGANHDEGDLQETYELLEYQLENDTSQGIKTFSGLDKSLGGGIQAGMLVTIGARPSVGKSAFAVNLIEKALQRNEGMRVDLFSLEMPKREVLTRFVSLKTGLNSYRLRNMNKLLYDKEKDTVRETIQYYKKKDIKVYDRVSDLKRIMSIIKERATGIEPDKYLVVIDYLGLIRVENSRKDRRLQIEEITRELKVLANEYRVPIVILSQLSRGVEQRQDKSPLLSDLRESGSIEQDSNVVGFLSNIETEENHEGYQRVEFQIKKNREGELLDIGFKFYKSKMLFDEVF